MEITVDLIKHLPLFAKLSEDDIAASIHIFKLIEPKESNYCIFKEGEVGDSLFLILKGMVEIQKVADKEAGINKVLAVLPAGAFFGEMALLTGETRSATAVLRGVKGSLLKVERDDFMNFMSSNSRIASLLLGSLVSSLSDRLRATSEESVALFETGRIIGQTHNYNEIISKVLDRMIKSSKASAGFIMMWNNIVECFECSIGLPEYPPIVRLEKDSVLSRYWQTLELPVTPESTDCFVDTKELGFGMPSVVYVPLTVFEEDAARGYERVKRVAGVVVLVSNNPKTFSLQKITLLRGIAAQVSQAIANIKLMQENESRRDFNQVYVSAEL